MSSTSVSPAAAYSSPQPRPPLPTPSPFSFSAASTRWSSRPPTQTANLSLRFLALVLNFAAASHWLQYHQQPPSSKSTPTASVITLTYQLFKGVCDIAHRGIFISDMVSDYISFIFDQKFSSYLNANVQQLAGYLVVSASSVAIPVIQHMYNGTSLRKAATVSVCTSFASFLVIAASGVLSGYRLCKRIMW
ncbi:UNVERIFIED_CONTAM: CASP-like protein 4A4 [Sesamum latifolium]|uniref:CASP-like protein 4A4 n=1 Tax=Sesamum latifolium TaxID=2727402 RepID=A0AAW2SPD7_9LAMI